MCCRRKKSPTRSGTQTVVPTYVQTAVPPSVCTNSKVSEQKTGTLPSSTQSLKPKLKILSPESKKTTNTDRKVKKDSPQMNKTTGNSNREQAQHEVLPVEPPKKMMVRRKIDTFVDAKDPLYKTLDVDEGSDDWDSSKIIPSTLLEKQPSKKASSKTKDD